MVSTVAMATVHEDIVLPTVAMEINIGTHLREGREREREREREIPS